MKKLIELKIEDIIKTKVLQFMFFLDYYGDESTKGIYSALDNYIAKTSTPEVKEYCVYVAGPAGSHDGECVYVAKTREEAEEYVLDHRHDGIIVEEDVADEALKR